MLYSDVCAFGISHNNRETSVAFYVCVGTRDSFVNECVEWTLHLESRVRTYGSFDYVTDSPCSVTRNRSCG